MGRPSWCGCRRRAALEKEEAHDDKGAQHEEQPRQERLVLLLCCQRLSKPSLACAATRFPSPVTQSHKNPDADPNCSTYVCHTWRLLHPKQRGYDAKAGLQVGVPMRAEAAPLHTAHSTVMAILPNSLFFNPRHRHSYLQP